MDPCGKELFQDGRQSNLGVKFETCLGKEAGLSRSVLFLFEMVSRRRLRNMRMLLKYHLSHVFVGLRSTTIWTLTHRETSPLMMCARSGHCDRICPPPVLSDLALGTWYPSAMYQVFAGCTANCSHLNMGSCTQLEAHAHAHAHASFISAGPSLILIILANK